MTPDEQTDLFGFRLERLEVLNWGTFHESVWPLNVRRENALVTGDIGSGKSTLVDAITTLLLPPQKQQYNKAAGADSRERSARSYVLGYYKKERGEGATSRPVALRAPGSYSVVLARFRHPGLDEDVTLAQVLWMTSPEGQPERMYLVAEQPLSIKDHFGDFGQDITGLRRRMRKLGIIPEENYPPYASKFRRLLGLDEQALALFHQTVSMKSIGSLTEFVREHMLEAFPVVTSIDRLLGHFEDLQRAHDAVLQATEQIATLSPLVADATRYEEVSRSIARRDAALKVLPSWFAVVRIEPLADTIATMTTEVNELGHEIVTLKNARDLDAASRDQLVAAISAAGGDRIEELKNEIARQRETRDDRRRAADTYLVLATNLGRPNELSSAAFEENRRWVEEERSRLDLEDRKTQQQQMTEGMKLQGLRDKLDELDSELRSLADRRSNIPRHLVALRDQMAHALGLDATSIPFVGELLQVHPEEAVWEGAIERYLRSFGLSMLVHDRDHERVASWVDETHLGQRFVYYRVRDGRQRAASSPGPRSLARKVQVQPKSAFYSWLSAELEARYDLVCCDTIEQFAREQNAITKQGQVKFRNERHEKDDRDDIRNRRSYVLGWSNEAKVAALNAERRSLADQITGQETMARQVGNHRTRLRERDIAVERLASVASYADLDWRSIEATMSRLEAERQDLEESSDTLKTLREQLDALKKRQKEREDALGAKQGALSKLSERRDGAQDELDVCRRKAASITDAERGCFGVLEEARTAVLGSAGLQLAKVMEDERRLARWLQDRISHDTTAQRELAVAVVRRMQQFCNAYPVEGREAGTGVEAIDEYRKILDRLVADDLPRFQATFKQLLNENTIREIAAFQSELKGQRDAIIERIERINESLHAIDYNDGRCIKLVSVDTEDIEVRDFKRDLRACTQDTLAGPDQGYTEEKFLQVKEILSRLRGRDGLTDVDRKWTSHVTDVRNWFEFSASERWRSDDSEAEFYPDASGKSGGQKEKLAYTVLAASLAYQFNLDLAQPRTRSFHFIVIDEAFGKGSDESARYALELFGRLGLQMLIVTPLQKIHVIEPYVASVGFVHNEDGKLSKLQNLTIEEYREQRAARAR